MRKVLPLLFTTGALLVCLIALPADAGAQRPKKKARKLASQGDQLYSRRRYQEALQVYARAIDISPVFPRAHYFKGYSHFRLDQTNDAIKEFGIALAQGFPEIDVVAIRMEAYFNNKDYDSALADANTAVRLAPGNSYYHTFLGRVMILKGDFGGAVGVLKKAIELGEKSVDAYYLLAVAYGATGNSEEQGNYASEALKRGTPYSGSSWYLLGDSQYKAKKYQDAAQSLTNSINAYKTDISTNRATDETEENLYRAYIDLSEVYRNLNRFDDAIDTAKAGLSLRPNDGNLHISLAWYFTLAGKTANAVAAGQKAVELSPAEYMAHTNLCRAYLDQGQYFYGIEDIVGSRSNFNKALSTCKRALQLQPNDGETNYYLGRTYFFLDNPQQSDSYYRKSVPGLEKFTKENPDYSDGFYLLGNAYFAIGENKKAIEAYLDCLRITPRFAIVRYNLGYVFVKEGDKEKAKNQQIMLQALDKDLAEKLGKVISGS